MSNIFISEFITSQALETLKARHSVIYQPDACQDPRQMADSLATAQALIVRNLTKVSKELVEGAKHLKVVGRLGVGLENIDLNACAERGIRVIPATGANAESVAEYVLGTAMALMRSYREATIETLAGKWPRPTYSKCHEIAGKTIGIVGFGSIGRVVAEKALALGMRCIAYDPFIKDYSISVKGGTVPICSLPDVLSQSQIVTLHLPLLPETKGLFNQALLDEMQEGAYLINSARGGIVDELALAQSLKSGKLGGAALDVFAVEPAKDLGHFVGVPNLILTPHVAGVTEESNDRVSSMIAREINLFLEKNT